MTTAAARSGRTLRPLVALIALGTAVRLALALTTDGVKFDLESFEVVDHALRVAGLDAYSFANATDNRWPYGPGFFRAIVGVGSVASYGDVFQTLIRFPAILADAALAWLVHELLRRGGAPPRTALAGAAAVALGPSFALVSGFHGQIDSVAILPAALALWAWTRDSEARHRALIAGALIGLGCAIKTVPIVMVLALLPSVRSRREAVELALAAAAVPLLAIAPFVLADPDGASQVLRYRGAAGLGGLSLLTHPSLPEGWLAAEPVALGGVTTWLLDNGGLIVAPALALAGLFLLRFRARPLDAALFAWLAVYVFGVNFFVQYFAWALPFLIARGHVRAAWALQAAVLPATLIVYHDVLGLGRPSAGLVSALYTPTMILFWVACVAALVLLGRRIAAGREPAAATLPRL